MYLITIFLTVIVCILLIAIAFLLNKIKQISTDFEYKIDDFVDEKANTLIENYKKQLDEKTKIELEKNKLLAIQSLQKEKIEFQKEVHEERVLLNKKEIQLDEKQSYIESQKEELDVAKNNIKKTKDLLAVKSQELENHRLEVEDLIVKKLEKLSGLTHEQAKVTILARAKKETAEELMALQYKMLNQIQDDVNKKAREIVSMAIQRCSSEVANEITVTAVKIGSEEDKGKLIGKQGRNIQWLEKTLGVELVIDDTPDIVTISGFSGLRRHIAKRTIEKLLADGRVHPSSIEEMYEKAKSEISTEIQNAGEEVLNDLGIYDFPPKLVRLIGRLKFRTSYGQNMLKHSMEMAKLAGLVADGLSAEFPTGVQIDRMTCVKGALLHDIGKAVDEESVPKGDHIELGEKICDMFDLGWKVKNCISSHHTTGGDYQSYHTEENGFCIEACIVDACDNISGGRLGARKETAEAYFNRMASLEKIVNNTPNVKKSYIMRAGKEMWVFFDSDSCDLAIMHETLSKIARKINGSIKIPFKIQIVGILEERLVQYTA